MDYIYTLTDNGVSLFNITCNKWGGNIGGPDTFSHGLVCGTSWEYSLSALFTAFSLSLAKAWNTSKSDWRTDTKFVVSPASFSTLFWNKFYM